MRHMYRAALAAAAITLTPVLLSAQAADANRKVEGGGIHVQGWKGKIDAKEIAAGEVLNNSKITKQGNDLYVMTGPAVTYWNPANKATGNYMVSAKFHEPKYMDLNTHPHPYGIMIAGNDLDTDQSSFLYCAAYGNGNFIVRGMGPAPFALNGGRGQAHEAVNKAAGKGQPVTQEIAIMVMGDKVDCIINGKTVASYPKADLIAAGKLKSTDGVYGIRFAHNTEATVSDFKVTKH